jgi:hypothetical protein
MEANFRTLGGEATFYPSECSDLDRISYDIRKTVRIEENGTLHGGHATLAIGMNGQSRSNKLVAASSQAHFSQRRHDARDLGSHARSTIWLEPSDFPTSGGRAQVHGRGRYEARSAPPQSILPRRHLHQEGGDK